MTARARRDRVTGQISNRTSRLEAIANLPCTPSALAVPIIRRGSSDVLRSESERSVLSRTNAAGVNNQLRMRYDFASRSSAGTNGHACWVTSASAIHTCTDAGGGRGGHDRRWGANSRINLPVGGRLLCNSRFFLPLSGQPRGSPLVVCEALKLNP